MQHSWILPILKRSVESVERWEALPCVVRLSGGYRIQIEGLWRLLSNGVLTCTSEDDGQLFGRSQPVDATAELALALVGRTLDSIDVSPGTADLTLSFGRNVLQAVSSSSGYEAWQVEGPQGTVAVGQGAGNVVDWD
jgi:hypothetical protein